MSRRVYLAGPMTGLPELNFHVFHAAARMLRRLGLEVVSPAELCPDPATPWADCMRRDIAELVRCQEIVMLPGWQASRGATLEHLIATSLGMPARALEDALLGPGAPTPTEAAAGQPTQGDPA